MAINKYVPVSSYSYKPRFFIFYDRTCTATYIVKCSSVSTAVHVTHYRQPRTNINIYIYGIAMQKKSHIFLNTYHITAVQLVIITRSRSSGNVDDEYYRKSNIVLTASNIDDSTANYCYSERNVGVVGSTRRYVLLLYTYAMLRKSHNRLSMWKKKYRYSLLRCETRCILLLSGVGHTHTHTRICIRSGSIYKTRGGNCLRNAVVHTRFLFLFSNINRRPTTTLVAHFWISHTTLFRSISAVFSFG